MGEAVHARTVAPVADAQLYRQGWVRRKTEAVGSV